MISIIDYGLGNLASVVGAVEKLGYVPFISNKPNELKNAQKLILPGVGAFRDGMNNLYKLGLIPVLNKLVLEYKRPILGICLGCQLMALESYEFGHHLGLGWVNASVHKLECKEHNLRIPHVGWDELIIEKYIPLFEGLSHGSLFYYTHSYFIKSHSPDLIIGKCIYGCEFVSAIQNENIYGVQFHPEKSQLAGLILLKNFIEKC